MFTVRLGTPALPLSLIKFMNSEQTPDAPPDNLNAAHPTPSGEVEDSAETGPHKVLLLAAAFGIALLVAAGVLFVGLSKL